MFICCPLTGVFPLGHHKPYCCRHTPSFVWCTFQGWNSQVTWPHSTELCGDMLNLSLCNRLKSASPHQGQGGAEPQSSAIAHAFCAQARHWVVREFWGPDPKGRRRFSLPLHAFSCRWGGVTWAYMESLPERPRIWTRWPPRARFSRTSTRPTPCAHRVSEG